MISRYFPLSLLDSIFPCRSVRSVVKTIERFAYFVAKPSINPRPERDKVAFGGAPVSRIRPAEETTQLPPRSSFGRTRTTRVSAFPQFPRASTTMSTVVTKTRPALHGWRNGKDTRCSSGSSRPIGLRRVTSRRYGLRPRSDARARRPPPDRATSESGGRASPEVKVPQKLLARDNWELSDPRLEPSSRGEDRVCSVRGSSCTAPVSCGVDSQGQGSG